MKRFVKYTIIATLLFICCQKEPQSIEVITQKSISGLTATSAICGGEIIGDGGYVIQERGICWNTTGKPTILDKHTGEGNGEGVFKSTLTELTPNTIYHVRAYAVNQTGVYYGEQFDFRTTECPIVLTTTVVSDIDSVSANCGGTISSDGGDSVTRRGVCWRASGLPTISDPHTVDGEGVGIFSSCITDLKPNTSYNVRAYATNRSGTYYGQKLSFTTAPGPPELTTNNVSNITFSSATCGGNIVSDGGRTIIARGVCWGTSANPSISNSHTTDGAGTGSFSSRITGLSPNMTYYVRAYATTNVGTYYGTQKTFFNTNTATYTVNGVSFVMVFVEGGTFVMGATDEQGADAESNEYPTHSVTLSDYCIGETEVTQALWQAVMGNNPSVYEGANLPVVNVCWNDVQDFISRLNNLTGENFMLPTEAEWEYAARGGSKSNGYKYSGSNDIGTVAWYGNNSPSHAQPVKTKAPNELGLYDMSGNVFEWCQDGYGSYSSYPQTNPTGPSADAYLRMYRGGSYVYVAKRCRVSYRQNASRTNSFRDLGFRLVCK